MGRRPGGVKEVRGVDKKRKSTCWNKQKNIFTLLGVIAGFIFMIALCAILSIL